MSDILDVAVDYVAATTRWSGDAQRMYLQGTLWYGIMCRSFLLLEQMLRLALVEASRFANSEIEVASKSRASGKPLAAMTFGQCVGVLEQIAPALPPVLVNACPYLQIPSIVLPERDQTAWNCIVSLRNRMAHDGPGFFDSVDFHAGRIWRRYQISEPLDQQAKEVWTTGRQLCRSPFVLMCIDLQGFREEIALARLDAAEAEQFTLQELGNVSEQAINEFHGG